MNKLLDRIDILQKIDTHILLQKEGSMIQLAKQLKISRRRLYAYFKMMEKMGTPVKINFDKHRLEYKTGFRLRAKINTNPGIVPPTQLYKKIKDVTLKRIILFNRVDELIYDKNTGPTKVLYKKLKMKDARACGNALYDFRKMGADFYFDASNQTYRYARRKRFNIILEVVPFKMPL